MMASSVMERRRLRKAIEGRRDLSQDEDFQKILGRFMDLHVPHPAVKLIERSLNEMRAETRLARSKGGEHQVLPIIGVSQSGKSHALINYMRHHPSAQPSAPGELPIVMTRISPKSSLRQLQCDLLRPLVQIDGMDTFDEKSLRFGTEAVFRNRVKRYAELRKTEVFIIDEAQHLIRGTDKSAAAVADSIKLCAIEGVSSFVVSGIPETWRIFRANDKQLPLRIFEPVFLDPLDFEDEDDALSFAVYLAALDQQMVDRGVQPELIGLSELAPEFYEVSQGVLGRCNRLLRVALRYACAIGEPITKGILEEATDRWAIKVGACRENPFRDGARSVRVLKKEWGNATVDIEGE
jgi:hypothetical protein